MKGRFWAFPGVAAILGALAARLDCRGGVERA